VVVFADGSLSREWKMLLLVVRSLWPARWPVPICCLVVVAAGSGGDGVWSRVVAESPARISWSGRSPSC
jgi:hypothetical protein